MTAVKKATRDFTEGPLFFRILTFSLPLMATALLSIFYNTADNIVVGRFSGDPLALAAVGSTTGLTSLITNFLFGFAAGGGVIIAQLFGAKDEEGVSKASHTIMTFSAIGGIVFMLIGLAVSKPALMLMGTKPELLDKAVLYLRIICLGIPFSSLYNFGASIIRSTGDSKTPLIILSCSGLVNLVLNMIFVIVFNMSVAGVALATVISQLISAVCIVTILLRKKNECFGIKLNKLGIDKKIFPTFFRYGLPSGINSSFFALTAVFMSSAVNTFPTAAVTARAISSNIDQLCHSTIASFASAAVTVVGQNFGAKKPERIKKSIFCLAVQTVVLGIIIGTVLLLFADKLALLFIEPGSADPDAIISFTMEILSITLSMSFINGTWQMLSGSVRGMGYSFTAMMISLIGAAIFRILWILFIFPLEPMNTITGLFMLFPFSWSLTGIMLGIAVFVAYLRLKRSVTQPEN